MNKKAIVIASVLKPVDDSRNFEKIGRSLAQTNKYEINIIGFSTKNKIDAKNITFHPHGPFNRISLSRILSPLKIFAKTLKLKPYIVIVNTHELLWVMCLYKIIFGCLLIYDIQENYYRNIRYTNTFPWPFRLPLAAYVRLKERLCNTIVDYYLLAEINYFKDLRFLQKRATIIENKTTLKPVSIYKPIPHSQSKINFIYTGTISKNYGIFDALVFIEKIRNAKIEIKLIIAGYCAKRSTLKLLKEKIAGKDHIKLIGGDNPIPHSQIIELLRQSDFALLPYVLDRSIIRCIPTKLYECIALKIPMIIRPNPLWLKLTNEFQACLPSKFTDVDESFLALLLNKKFYTKGSVETVLWDTERTKLLELFERIDTE
jgi:glycosyltransferase involved in cell wall biosynthesis